ncbi:MAG: hypothetical protein H0W49_11330 [Nitrospirales bacterium]|nr:hypothetical protein [Nitrospirales bacterium]
MSLESGNDSEILKTRYEELRSGYENLVKEVTFTLEKKLNTEGLEIVSIMGRVKTLESLMEKIERKQYSNPLADVTDLAGVRVVCQFTPDVKTVDSIVRQLFSVLESENKAIALGADHMGYSGTHHLIQLDERYKGSRYDGLDILKCEIQVRTILQDAWAQINHSLVYKSEASIPERERRELNNVSALLEVAQTIFDRSRKMRKRYAEEVKEKQNTPTEFLSQPIDRETVAAYTSWRYPDLPINENLQEMLLEQLDHNRYRTLKKLDEMISMAEKAVNAYKCVAPELFKSGTDHITKSLGFTDKNFRKKHAFGPRTSQALSDYEKLVPNRRGDA